MQVLIVWSFHSNPLQFSNFHEACLQLSWWLTGSLGSCVLLPESNLVRIADGFGGVLHFQLF